MEPRTDIYWGSRSSPQLELKGWDCEAVVKLLAQNALSAALAELITIIKQQCLLVQRSNHKPRPFAVHASKPSSAFYNAAIESHHKDYVLQHRAKEAQTSARLAARRAERNVEAAYVFSRSHILGKREKRRNAVGNGNGKGEEGFNWVRHNSQATEHELSRLEHLMTLLEAEQVKETKREVMFYDTSMPPRQLEYERRKVARSRANAADMIMRTLVDYGLVSIVAYAHYLKSIPKQPAQLTLKGKLHRVPAHLPKPKKQRKRAQSKLVGTSSGHYQGRSSRLDKEEVKQQRKRVQSDESCGIFELRRRYKETSAKRSSPLGKSIHTAATASTSTSMSKAIEMQSMGGWGPRISYEGERIIEAQKAKLAGFEQDECRVYKVDYTTSQYSFVLHRPMAKRIGE